MNLGLKIASFKTDIASNPILSQCKLNIENISGDLWINYLRWTPITKADRH